MDFLGIGFWELIIIFLVSMMVFGPRRLPEVAAKAGKIVRDLRGMSQGLVSEWQREITVAARLDELEKVRKELDEVKRDIDQAQQDIGQTQKAVAGEAQKQLKEAQQDVTAAATVSQKKADNPKPTVKQPSNSDEKPESASDQPQESRPTRSLPNEKESGAEPAPDTTQAPNSPKLNDSSTQPAEKDNKISDSVDVSPPVVSPKPIEVLNE